MGPCTFCDNRKDIPNCRQLVQVVFFLPVGHCSEPLSLGPLRSDWICAWRTEQSSGHHADLRVARERERERSSASNSRENRVAGISSTRFYEMSTLENSLELNYFMTFGTTQTHFPLVLSHLELNLHMRQSAVTQPSTELAAELRQSTEKPHADELVASQSRTWVKRSIKYVSDFFPPKSTVSWLAAQRSRRSWQNIIETIQSQSRKVVFKRACS